MKRRLAILTAFLLCLNLGQSAVLADPQADLSQTEQQLNQKASEVHSLADELKLLDATINAKAAYAADLIVKGDAAKMRLQTANRELASLQRARKDAQRTLERYLRAAYVNRGTGQIGIIVGDKSVAGNLADASYRESLQDYSNRVVAKAASLEKRMAHQQEEARNAYHLIDSLEAEGDQENAELAGVRAAKAQLLARTQNQEQTFRQQFESGKLDLAKTGHFARSARDRLKSRVWSDDGFYFNQLDSRWIDDKLGFSDTSTLGDYGCGVTVLAMVYKYYGFDITPPRMNDSLKNTRAFVDDLLDWRNTVLPSGGRLQLANDPYPLGRDHVDWNFIDRQLASGNPVIVYLDRGGDLSHYVLLTDKRQGDYLMHDPLEGPNLRFADHYSKSAVYQYISFRRS